MCATATSASCRCSTAATGATTPATRGGRSAGGSPASWVPARSATSARMSSTSASTCAGRSSRSPAASCRSRSRSARCRSARSSGTTRHRSATSWARSRTRTPRCSPPASGPGSWHVLRVAHRVRDAERAGFRRLRVGGRASFDFHRPAEYQIDDPQPRAAAAAPRQVIVGPQMPYFRGGYPMEAPGSAAATRRCSPTRPARSSTRSPGRRPVAGERDVRRRAAHDGDHPGGRAVVPDRRRRRAVPVS